MSAEANCLYQGSDAFDLQVFPLKSSQAGGLCECFQRDSNLCLDCSSSNLGLATERLDEQLWHLSHLPWDVSGKRNFYSQAIEHISSPTFHLDVIPCSLVDRSSMEDPQNTADVVDGLQQQVESVQRNVLQHPVANPRLPDHISRVTSGQGRPSCLNLELAHGQDRGPKTQIQPSCLGPEHIRGDQGAVEVARTKTRKKPELAVIGSPCFKRPSTRPRKMKQGHEKIQNDNLRCKAAIEAKEKDDKTCNTECSCKTCRNSSSFCCIKQEKREELLAMKGVIHVRARRGEATDNHSLAERLRRERINERMKLLQNLVPNCHQVGGKAVILEEIINYIQSLQHQVELLSMKIASATAFGAHQQ